MLYRSTQGQSPLVDFQEAAIAGQAPDKGLYFPVEIPVFTAAFLRDLRHRSRADVAFDTIRPYIGDTIPADDLQRICAETVDFDFPLVSITDRIASLELFHGPTLAFKDVGARFMSRCLGYFSRNSDREVTVLVATSGDTGGAVAHGFLGVKGVNVVILYPSGKVSAIQEKQLTALGQNITALEIDGAFDDCQHLVKQAFADTELRTQRFLTSANSINVARWLPQQFYYLYALQQWPQDEAPPVISVPSGNFGNLCAGLLAHASGLPAGHFVAACNENQVFVRYLQTGDYMAQPTIPTISNAMDVGAPNNFVRLLEFFHHDLAAVRESVSGYSINDADTRDTMRRVFQQHRYLLDPHGAVAYAALEKHLDHHPEQRGIILETAHPCKFLEVVEEACQTTVPLPPAVRDLDKAEKKSMRMAADYAALRAFLLEEN